MGKIDFTEAETRQWAMFIGALLMCDKDSRDQAMKMFASEDIPSDYVDLWRDLKQGNGANIRQAAGRFFPVGPEDKRCFDGLVKALQRGALARLCRRTIGHTAAASSGLLEPDQLLALLEGAVAKIAAKKATLGD